MVPFSVYCPPFEIASGGIRVMWGLYGWLLAKGQVVFPNVQFPNTDFVAIYPEIVNGNPLKATKIIRYILNKPGVMHGRNESGHFEAGPTTFDPTDKLYVFSEIFNTVGADENHHLFLPILDLHTFMDQKKKRTKKAVFVGKGINTNEHPKDCIYIDRQIAQDQQKLADLLNECEVMYQYDPVSAMSEVARLCGCRVVMLQNIYGKDDYLRKYEPGINGIGWREDVPLDVEGFTWHYVQMKRKFSTKLDYLIQEAVHENA